MEARVKRALISVSEKRGLADFAHRLAQAGVEILSTGGTAKALREAGVHVIEVSNYTGSPEIMEGRVKTLHPRVHGGILMRSTEKDRRELDQIGGSPIDLVCVNLYPFEETVMGGAAHEQIIENIDIGGPSMIRSAAKNYARVTVVTEPNDYQEVSESILKTGGTSFELRMRLASKAFEIAARYDEAIAAYLASISSSSRREEPGESSGLKREGWPKVLNLGFEKIVDLRYGENPHQTAAFYAQGGSPQGTLARAVSLGSGAKELSFNNLVDLHAALDAVRELERPAAVVVKHTNPCGVAEAESLEQAYRLAREADPVSAFGGIVALNRRVDEATARALLETFLECTIAPSYEASALELLRTKKNLRVLGTGEWLPASYEAREWKCIDGGLAVQRRDRTGAGEVASGRTVTDRAPTDEEIRTLEFAWRVAKHVKSNAIVLAHPGHTVGIGAGQMSRVVSVEIAVRKAGVLTKNSVLASDAFFPFPDGVEIAAAAGITAIAQPGGSVKDSEVIAAANRSRIAMVFTGVRHFRH